MLAFANVIQSNFPWRTNNTDDVQAIERGAAFGIGLFSDPVYVSGDWPDLVKETLPPSFLPRFTQQEKNDLKGRSSSVLGF
jgi:beta-glucosidase